jgi:signal transduction histidine kinase
VHEFFEQNETIILFAHGLMFFALGFAVWLQRRRTTRLTLTSSLIWLAAFAFVESLAIWGYVFVPIQDDTLGEGFVDGLMILRAMIHTVAFLFLLQFGLRLSPLSANARRSLSALSLALWVGIVLGGVVLARGRGWSVAEWEGAVVGASRYVILLPGAILSAVGLWRQRGELAAAGMTAIKPWVTGASVALAAYAVVGGLVVESEAPWAPGGPGHEEGFFSAIGFPLAAVRGTLGLVLCVAAVKLLEIFEVEAKQRFEALDRARAVAEERGRFGRDLHDGTIQSLYAAGLNLEALALRSEDPGLRAEVRKVVAGLNETITRLRRYIRALHQPPATPASVSACLGDLTRRCSSEMGLRAVFRAEGTATAGPLPDQSGEHLEQILREALANVARHAGPCSVDVVLAFRPDEMNLLVTDNGCGLDPAAVNGAGQGLRNMRERARRLGGRLTVEPTSTGGTRVALAVPLDSESPAPQPADALQPLEEVTFRR